jgi:hypothetical protein
MKRMMILTLVALLFCLNGHGNAQSSVESRVLVQQETLTVAGEVPPSAIEPPEPRPKASEESEKPPLPSEPTAMPEIFFAAGTVSADDKYLYVIFDRFLLKYALPALELMRKLDLDIAAAPVSPSISISEDSKYLYIICNGVLYQIDVPTFKIEKRIRIMP